MNKKVKAFMLIELIISIFIISIIALGIFKTLITFINLKDKLLKVEEMNRIAVSVIECSFAEEKFGEKDGYKIEVKTTPYSDSLDKIFVKVRCDEISEEVQLISYKRSKD